MNDSNTAKTVTLTTYKDTKGCEDESASKKIDSYTFAVPPRKFSVEESTDYACDEPVNASGGRTNYKVQKPASLNLVQVIDGTGLLADQDVDKEVKSIKKLLAYDGDIHEPPCVRITWGDESYVARFKSKKIEHKSILNGEQLKSAEISIDFVGDMSDEKRAKSDKKSSPDLTHQRITEEGDTWQKYSFDFYKTTKYAAVLARYNEAFDLRWIPLGKKIFIPPLEKLISYAR